MCSLDIMWYNIYLFPLRSSPYFRRTANVAVTDKMSRETCTWCTATPLACSKKEEEEGNWDCSSSFLLHYRRFWLFLLFSHNARFGRPFYRRQFNGEIHEQSELVTENTERSDNWLGQMCPEIWVSAVIRPKLFDRSEATGAANYTEPSDERNACETGMFALI